MALMPVLLQTYRAFLSLWLGWDYLCIIETFAWEKKRCVCVRERERERERGVVIIDVFSGC